TIYTDGSCINNGKVNARCSSGIWIAENDPGNRAIRVPGPTQSNQVGELVAVIVALQNTDLDIPVTIKTDSEYVIDGLTQNLTTWEDNGWIGIANSTLFRVAAYLLRARTAITEFKWIKGHSGIIGNEKADRKADEGARKDEPDDLDLHIPDNFNLEGAKLSTISQSLAYKGIRERKTKKTKNSTSLQLEIARAALEDFTGVQETDESLWQNCRRRDMSKKTNQFIYRALHNSFKIGTIWKHIPGYENRQRCSRCGDPEETLEHILVDCPDPVPRRIWTLAKDLWPHGDDSWPTLSLGILLACGNLTLTNDQTHINATTPNNAHPRQKPTARTQGASRLLRIIISESLYLIWTTRCEQAINGTTYSQEQITTRWYRAIQDRLVKDRIYANKIQRTKQAINKLKHTWHDTLINPPDNWHKNYEVLVGMNPPRPPT
ncbi:ribonuclease H-like protein, partial [Dentipellis sp. KUC8613]